MHYHFVSKEEFEKGIAEGKFLEYAYVHRWGGGQSVACEEGPLFEGGGFRHLCIITS